VKTEANVDQRPRQVNERHTGFDARRCRNENRIAVSVIVLESRPRWVPELRRRLIKPPISVRACRSLIDARESARGSVLPCLLLIDLSVTPEACVTWMGQRTREERRHAVVAIAPSTVADLEWILRDLGASAVLSDASTADEVARVCQRQWQAVRETR
jgi:hypothetical protein